MTDGPRSILSAKQLSAATDGAMDDDEPEAPATTLAEEDKLTFLESQEMIYKLISNAPAFGLESETVHLERYMKKLRLSHQESLQARSISKRP